MEKRTFQSEKQKNRNKETDLIDIAWMCSLREEEIETREIVKGPAVESVESWLRSLCSLTM